MRLSYFRAVPNSIAKATDRLLNSKFLTAVINLVVLPGSIVNLRKQSVQMAGKIYHNREL